MKDKKGNLTIKQVARLMNKSEQFVRIGLQRNILPFGVAIKLDGKAKYSYHISPNKFYEYMGITETDHLHYEE